MLQIRVWPGFCPRTTGSIPRLTTKVTALMVTVYSPPVPTRIGRLLPAAPPLEQLDGGCREDCAAREDPPSTGNQPLGSVGSAGRDVPGGSSFVAFASRTGPGFVAGWSASSAAIRPADAVGTAFSVGALLALFFRLLLRCARPRLPCLLRGSDGGSPGTASSDQARRGLVTTPGLKWMLTRGKELVGSTSSSQ
ncbi:hypothetical protein ACLKA7_001977 [Drosophila subpalustris]